VRQFGEEDGHEREIGQGDDEGPDGVEEVEVDGVGGVPGVAQFDIYGCI
jgi:hypothetical protein